MSTFYGLLFERYPQARSLFGRNSQKEQQKMLTEALVALVMHLDDDSFIEQTMLALGRKHIDYKVEDHMYPWVGECLLETLKRASGPSWSPALESAWGDVLASISAIAIRGAGIERSERAAASA